MPWATRRHSVVYNGAGDMVAWIEPPTASEEEVAPEEAPPPARVAPVANSLHRLPNRKVLTAPPWTQRATAT